MQGRTRRGGGPKLTKYQKQRIMGRPATNKSGLPTRSVPVDTKKFQERIQKANKPTPKTGGSPNQKLKEEKKKNIKRPGRDDNKTPTGVNRPGTSDKKKVVRNKIKSLSGDFMKSLLMFGIPLGSKYFATKKLYKEYLKKKKMKT